MIKQFLSLLLLTPLLSFAQETILFELSKGGKPTSYLFGTIHVQNEEAFNFGDSVLWAVEQSGVVMLEADLSAAGMSGFNTSIYQDFFNEEDIEKYTTFLKDMVMPKMVEQVPVSKLMSKIKDEIVPAYMEIIERQFDSDNRSLFVDMYLQQYAESKGIEVNGIETLEEQFKIIFDGIKEVQLDEKFASQIITSLIEENWVESIAAIYTGTEDLVKAYSEFDLNSICDMMDNELNSDSKFTRMMYDKILIQRNDIMFSRTLPIVEKEPIFIGVGSGHLCGSNGLISQYLEAGYTVRPMNVEVKSVLSINWEKTQGDGYSVDMPKGIALTSTSDDLGMAAFMQDMSEATPSSTLFTSSGMVTFNVLDLDGETEEYGDMGLMYQELLEKMEEYEDDAVETEEEAYLEEAIELDEAAVEYAVESVNEGVESVYEENTEAVLEEVYEYEEELINEKADDAEEVEMEESSYEYYQQQSNKGPFGGEFTEEQEAYFEELKDSFEASKDLFMQIGMSAMTMFSPESDTSDINIAGDMVPLVYSSTMLSKSLTATINKDDRSFRLTVSGDPAILKSEEILRFFTSFKLEE